VAKRIHLQRKKPAASSDVRNPLRRIAFVTGSRAEFGLLRSTIDAALADKRVELQLIVAGSHFLAGTRRDIHDAGYEIAAEVRMQKRGHTGRSADALATARGMDGFCQAFSDLTPDVVVVLGDRIEVFAAASAAAISGICVAHIHGGDRAEGVADESLRHAISKLAHLHLPATEQSRQRLVRMGERPDLVFNVGSPAVDGLASIEPASDAPDIMVMLHPVGDAEEVEYERMATLLRVTEKQSRMVFEPNLDPGRQGIIRAIRDAGVTATQHLPRERFLALLKGARAIVGNSSAGLIEAAILSTRCVNVGNRQSGREKPRSVLDCTWAEAALRRAVAASLAPSRGRKPGHPYGPGGTGPAIVELLAGIDLADVPRHKHNTY